LFYETGDEQQQRTLTAQISQPAGWKSKLAIAAVLLDLRFGEIAQAIASLFSGGLKLQDPLQLELALLVIGDTQHLAASQEPNACARYPDEGETTVPG
jgi:hypothetical protein